MEVKVFSKGRAGVYNAEGIYTEKCFTVCKGSQIALHVSSKIQPVVMKIRNNKDLVSAAGKVIKDVTFRSPSTAAAFVTGNIANGNKVWKDKDGRKLGELRRKKENG